ncbi:hypothetical protein ABPG74_002809 [Tetrahymena malaccensis]
MQSIEDNKYWNIIKQQREFKSKMIQSITFFKKLDDFLSSNLSSHIGVEIQIRCKIGSQGVQNITSALINCTNLTILTVNFSNNQIGIQEAQYIGNSVVKYIKLSTLTLRLNSTQIDAKSLQLLGTSLANCASLKYLTIYLITNSISGEGAQSLYLSLVNCLKISTLTLNLDDNLIDDISISKLRTNLYKMKRLVLKHLFI